MTETVTTEPEFSEHECLTLLIHSDAKVGKTTLSLTAPYPLVILDVDGRGSKTLQARKVYWDPHTQPPPTHDDTWDVCVVYIRDWATVLQAYNWLATDQHQFVSFALDSVTEVQRRCRKNLKGSDAMQTQDWGMLLSKMEDVLRDYRDLVGNHPTLRVGLFIAESRRHEKTLRWEPHLQGSISKSVPYWMDIMGFLGTELLADANGQLTQLVRKLCIGIDPHNQYQAGGRTGGRIPDVVYNPNITEMLRMLYKNEGTQLV
jgi:hypothetical protein